MVQQVGILGQGDKAMPPQVNLGMLLARAQLAKLGCHQLHLHLQLPAQPLQISHHLRWANPSRHRSSQGNSCRCRPCHLSRTCRRLRSSSRSSSNRCSNRRCSNSRSSRSSSRSCNHSNRSICCRVNGHHRRHPLQLLQDEVHLQASAGLLQVRCSSCQGSQCHRLCSRSRSWRNSRCHCSPKCRCTCNRFRCRLCPPLQVLGFHSSRLQSMCTWHLQRKASCRCRRSRTRTSRSLCSSLTQIGKPRPKCFGIQTWPGPSCRRSGSHRQRARRHLQPQFPLRRPLPLSLRRQLSPTLEQRGLPSHGLGR